MVTQSPEKDDSVGSYHKLHDSYHKLHDITRLLLITSYGTQRSKINQSSFHTLASLIST